MLTMTLYKSDKETNVRTDLRTTIDLLEKLKSKKKLDYKIIDTSKMSEPQRTEAYGKAVMASVYNKYQVRTVFGTNRQSGFFFGKEQPALLVEGDIWDIYPHKKDGKIITIEGFLSKLVKTLE